MAIHKAQLNDSYVSTVQIFLSTIGRFKVCGVKPAREVLVPIIHVHVVRGISGVVVVTV